MPITYLISSSSGRTSIGIQLTKHQPLTPVNDVVAQDAVYDILNQQNESEVIEDVSRHNSVSPRINPIRHSFFRNPNSLTNNHEGTDFNESAYHENSHLPILD